MRPPCIASVLLLAVSALAQDTWSVAHVSPPRAWGEVRHFMCYAEADGHVLAVCLRAYEAALETWVWDGARWHLRRPATSPPARMSASFGYDTARGVAVLFGGVTGMGAVLADTWEWNGLDWTRVNPASSSPPARYSAAAAFDPGRGRFVIYGGRDAARQDLSDQWEWDGADWVPVALASPTPGPQSDGSMACDAARDVLVMARPGGGTVWEFDGSSWSGPLTSTPPGGSGTSPLAYDPVTARVVTFGANQNLWEWDGAQWTERVSAANPNNRFLPALAYDESRDEFVLFGGVPTDRDTWTWNRASNTWNATPHDGPVLIDSRTRAATHVGGGRTLVYSSVDSGLWEHARNAWTPVASTAPPLRPGVAMAYDSLRQEAVLFGASSRAVAQTHAWSATSGVWVDRSGGSAPPALESASLAYDPLRDRTVLFGGYRLQGPGNRYSGETWEWDGSTWTRRFPVTSPSPRYGASAAFDPATNLVVLFGGSAGSTRYNDVWEWNGVDWSQRTMLTPGPSPRAGGAAVARGSDVLVYGGFDGSSQVDELWSLQGQAWLQLPSPTEFVARGGALMAAADPVRDELVIFGGTSRQGDSTGVWRYGPPRARATPIGGGCAGTFGVPRLATNSEPVLGNAAFALEASSVPAMQTTGFLLGVTPSLVGLPNRCRLFVLDPFAAVVRPSSPLGVASLAISVPLQPAFAGRSIYVQSVALDLPGSDVVLSNAMRLGLGY